MAHFLRDELVSNLSIDEDGIRHISATFETRWLAINSEVGEGDASEKAAFLTYIIRFDGKGYRVFSLNELLKYFHHAKEVERIIFTVETGESLRSNRQIGTFMELRLDAKDASTCFFTVTSDKPDWVEASFSAVHDGLGKYKNRNGLMRTAWTPLVVQIIGVTFGFVLSLWATAKISPKLEIEKANAFVFSFLFALLIFSNVWTYLNQIILAYIGSLFPSIKFYRARKDRVHWFMQAIVGGIAVAIVLYVLGLLFSYAAEILGTFVPKNG